MAELTDCPGNWTPGYQTHCQDCGEPTHLHRVQEPANKTGKAVKRPTAQEFTMTPCNRHWEQVRAALPEPFWLLVIGQAMKKAAEYLLEKGITLEAFEAKHEGECFICLTDDDLLLVAMRDIRDEVNAQLGAKPFDPGEKRDLRPPKGFESVGG